MANDNNRVLGRRGAHLLTENEIQRVGGALLTVPSVIVTGPLYSPDVHTDSDH
jgi:hypothetical protein